MTKAKSAGRASASYTIGRKNFAKISAVDGIRPRRRVEAEFKEFDRLELSPADRRREIARKYDHKS